MSDAPRRCAGCGAEAPRSDARFCEHCGAALPRTEPEAPAPEPADPLGDVEARFRALGAHPELPWLLENVPDVPELRGKVLPSLLLLLALTVLGLFASMLCFQLCPPLGFVPFVLVAVSAVAVTRHLIENARAPARAHAALVVELRSRLQAGAEHSPTHTRHFATLELEDRSRQEHECLPSAVDALERGRMGVAYLKGERLAAFLPLDV